MAAHLIPVFTGELIQQQTQTCNARNLHTALKVGRVFGTWITGRIEQYGFIEGEDFWVLDFPKPGNQKKRHGGDRRSIDYRLTLDMAKELAMIENNDIGRQVRRYFIKAEAELWERITADLRQKAEHVLPIQGVQLMRDSLSLRDAIRLQEQSRKVLRLIMEAKTKAERKNLHYHFHQINITLGMPTIELDAIEAEISATQPALEG